MKLIKQNDSAGGLIFKQNQNGKAMKQNYNFGRGFNSNNNIYSEAELDTVLDGFSFIIFGKNWYSSDLIPFLVIEFSNGTRIDISSRGITDSLRLKITNSPDFPNIDAIGLGKHTNAIFSVAFSNNRIYYNGTLIHTLTESQIPANYFSGKIITKIRIGITSDATRFMTMGESTFFNREISQTEISYMHNNLLGNEPLNSVGILSRYLANNAAVNGTDIVYEDVVGTHHQKIIGLPAGTIQEQLDYANSNHFPKFI